MTNYVTIKKFSELSGYSAEAIRQLTRAPYENQYIF
jgi:hypothetical protein